jgi:hypothetical protein
MHCNVNIFWTGKRTGWVLAAVQVPWQGKTQSDQGKMSRIKSMIIDGIQPLADSPAYLPQAQNPD